MPKKKSKKKSKRSSSPRKDRIEQRREAALAFMERTLERIDPIEGMTFLGLTYSIYKAGTPVIDIFLKVVSQLAGFASDWYPGKAVKQASEGVEELLEPIDWKREFSNLGMYEIEELQRAVKGLTDDIQKSLFGAYAPANKGPKLDEWEHKAYLYLTYGIGPEPGERPTREPAEPEKEYHAAKKIVMEAKLISLMLAMGAAGLLMYFFKSYEWSELIENVPRPAVRAGG